MVRRRLLLLVLPLLLLFPGTATSAPFTLSQSGFFPDVAVDGEGTGHFVWTERDNGPGPDVLHYCRVPRGATSCATEKTFTFSPPDEHRPRVVIGNDGTIVLLDYRCCSPTATPNGGAGHHHGPSITSRHDRPSLLRPPNNPSPEPRRR